MQIINRANCWGYNPIHRSEPSDYDLIDLDQISLVAHEL